MPAFLGSCMARDLYRSLVSDIYGPDRHWSVLFLDFEGFTLGLRA